MTIEVWSRDANRVRRGLLPVLFANAVFRESGVHTWVMGLDGNDPESELAQAGTGIIVMDGATTLLSGKILGIEHESVEGVRTTTIKGESDMRILQNRMVHPDHTRAWNAQTTKTHYSYKGVAETLIVDLVNRQAGPGSSFSYRHTQGLPLQVSQGRGASTTINARWNTTVLDEVQSLARVGGLVVDLVQVYESTDYGLVFRVPQDLSRSVRFMEGQGLGDYRSETASDTATVVYVGGQGEGTARTIYAGTRPTAESWDPNERIEVWRERSDTTDTQELAKTVQEALAETAITGAVSFDVTETADLLFGVDYHLGDTVTVAFPGGGEIIDRVRAAEVEWNEHGRIVRLTVGNFSTDAEVDQDTKRIRRIADQLRRLEAR